MAPVFVRDLQPALTVSLALSKTKRLLSWISGAFRRPRSLLLRRSCVTRCLVNTPTLLRARRSVGEVVHFSSKYCQAVKWGKGWRKKGNVA